MRRIFLLLTVLFFWSCSTTPKISEEEKITTIVNGYMSATKEVRMNDLADYFSPSALSDFHSIFVDPEKEPTEQGLLIFTTIWGTTEVDTMEDKEFFVKFMEFAMSQPLMKEALESMTYTITGITVTDDTAVVTYTTESSLLPGEVTEEEMSLIKEENVWKILLQDGMEESISTMKSLIYI